MVSLEESEIQNLYEMYPRKIGKRSALRAIEKAVTRLGKEKPELRDADKKLRIEWLSEKLRAFAESKMGNAGEFTPYPATWFNQSRYLDDPKEWGVEKKGKCARHPFSGLTVWGSCWDCYMERFSQDSA